MGEWRAAVNRLEGAYAPTTLRGYERDFEAFFDWCAENGRNALPADADAIAAFLDGSAAVASPATLRRRISGIRKIHRLLRLPDPTNDEEIAIALRRARRSRPSRPNQALGLTRAKRDALIEACDDRPIGLRNQVLVAVGYDTLCRRSELVALRAEDLEPRAQGGYSVLVRRAKNDPFGLGRTAWISRRGADILDAWLGAAGISRGPILRPVYNGVVIERILHAYSVARVLKSLASKAGFAATDVAKISGHSLRVGAAQDLMSNGRDLLTIMRAGGWTSVNVVSRYVEAADWQIWD